MKKIVFAFLLTISFQINAQWNPIHPTPFIDNCFAFYADENNCRVLTQGANIVFSSNGGTSWNYHYSNSYFNIQKIFFIDPYIGWASDGIRFLKTTDGGFYWEDKGFNLNQSDEDFFFKNTLDGWAVGNSYISHTSDGGENWDRDTLQGNNSLHFISQYNDSVLFTGGQKLFRSIDSGKTWIQHPNPLILTMFRDFLSADNSGLLVGNYYNIVKTTDAGETWQLVFPNDGFYKIFNMEYHNGLILTCGTDRVLRSTDLGNTWDSTVVPSASYHSICFATDSTIYISGKNGALIKSTDRGLSFQSISVRSITDPINSTSFLDSLNGYLITNLTPKVYKTTDGGKSFIDITPVGMNQEAHFILAVSKDIVVLVSDIRIYITKDGGLNWSYSSYGPLNTYVPNEIIFRDSLNGIAGCYWNLIRETTDGGVTWSNRVMGLEQEHIQSITFSDYLNGFYCTGDKLYKTTTGGVDWLFVRNLDPMFSKIRFITSDRGVGATFNGIYYTTDGGLNWIKSEDISFVNSFDIKKHGSISTLMVLGFDSMFTSYDLGLNWESEFIPFATLGKIQMSNPSTAWLSGYSGEIVRYVNENLPSNIQSVEQKLNSFNLSQNYPNPFNPSTKIKFTISIVETHRDASLLTTLKVYDILGNEVATLVNDYRSAGSYEVDFQSTVNNRQLANGVYFYRLQAGDYVETKKMILLK